MHWLVLSAGPERLWREIRVPFIRDSIRFEAFGARGRFREHCEPEVVTCHKIAVPQS